MPTEREKAKILLTGNPKTINLLIMGLFQYYKWDEINHKEQGSQQISNDDIYTISNGFTRQRWLEFEDTAEKTLRALTATEDKWILPIVQGVVSAFIYSIILVLFLVVIKWNGVDILHALGIEPKVIFEGQNPESSKAK